MLLLSRGRSESADSDCGDEAVVVSPDLIGAPFLVAGKIEKDYSLCFLKLVFRSVYKILFLV